MGKGVTALLPAVKASSVSLLCCLSLACLVLGAPFFTGEANRFPTYASGVFLGSPWK